MTKRTQFGPVAHEVGEVGALRTPDLNRVTVDTTVQPKAITFVTDAKLLHAAIKGLNRLARKCGGRLRESCLRDAKRAPMMASRYGHAKQSRRHHRQLRLLRSRLGRITRDIRRKIAGRPELAAVFRSAIIQLLVRLATNEFFVTGRLLPTVPRLAASLPARSAESWGTPSHILVVTPAGRNVFEGLTSVRQSNGCAGRRLIAADNDVNIERIELHAAAYPSSILGGD